jgi:large subunit ribosomal protein L28
VGVRLCSLSLKLSAFRKSRITGSWSLSSLVCYNKGSRFQNLSSAGIDMALKCDLCGKGPQYGNVVSHANNTRRRRWNPNLKRVRAIVAGAHKHLRVCTACIRAGKVTKVGASRVKKAA